MIHNTVLEKLEYIKVLQQISKYSVTEPGKELILKTTPLNNKIEAEREGNYVTEAKEILIRNSNPPIEYLPNLFDSLSKSRIEGAFLESKKILEVLRLAQCSRSLISFLKSNEEIAPGLLSESNALFSDKMFEHHISSIIDDSGEVKENASRKLQEIRSEIKHKNIELVKAVNRIMKNLDDKDIMREEYLTLRDGRIVIPIKVEHKRHIRGFIHSESSSGQTVYIEPEETLDLNNEIISLSFAEKREIERLLRELTKKVGENSEKLKYSLEMISYYDSIFAKAKYSIEIIGAFPQMNEKKPFLLIDGRHPLLLKRLGRNNTVPLKIEIDKNRVIIITGPNAGGKTVVLKTIGLLSLMVQSGIHIPASIDSNFHYFQNVLADIGDEQSIDDDLSTFSSHLSNIFRILNIADNRTLVLLDEIGTGTDPAEGSAIAAAILIKLQEKGAIVFASTHHGNLKLIAGEMSGFENAAMEFDTLNLKPTYYFKQGIPGSSYAFEIAKRIGYNKDFLMLAEKHLDTDKHKVEEFLVDIEKKSSQLNNQLKAAEIENSRLAGLTNLYKNNIEKLEKEKKEIVKKAKQEADEYLRGMNKKIESLVKDIKERNADKDSIKNAKQTISEFKEVNRAKVSETEDKEASNEKNLLEVGDNVLVKNTQTKGEITEINESKGFAFIKVGSLKIKVQLKDLEKTKNEKVKLVNSSIYDYNATQIQFRLDIRGYKPEEIEFDIIKFIDNAYSSGVDRVEILHGKGTGVLKKLVKEILKAHTGVKSFNYAPVEFGGDGITIVDLK